MIGYSPKFPLQINDYVGAYALNTEITDVVAQNFKNLMLTAPGERIMDINFGVGLRRFLFEPNTPLTQGDIANKIRTQVTNYMPFVGLQSIQFNSRDISNISQDQILDVHITYRIPGEADEQSILISIDQEF